MKEIESQYASGLVTQGEKYNKVVDIWSRANDLVATFDDGRHLERDRSSIATGKDEDAGRRSTRSSSTPTPARGVRRRRFASWRVCGV